MQGFAGFTDILRPNEVKNTNVNSLRSERVKYRFLVADTPYAIPHSAGKMPTGYSLVSHVRIAAKVTEPALGHELTDKIKWSKNIIVIRCSEPGDAEIEVKYGIS